MKEIKTKHYKQAQWDDDTPEPYHDELGEWETDRLMEDQQVDQDKEDQDKVDQDKEDDELSDKAQEDLAENSQEWEELTGLPHRMIDDVHSKEEIIQFYLEMTEEDKPSANDDDNRYMGITESQATGKAFWKLGQEDRDIPEFDEAEIAEMRKEYDFDDDYGMEPWEEEDVDERHDVMDPHEDEYVLSFDMEGDYLTRGRDVTDDVQDKFKDFYSGSGSGGSGYDFSLTGPEEALEVIKKYVEDKYTHEVMDSSIDLIDW